MPAPTYAWEPTEADWSGLEASGRAFVESMLSRYEFSLPDGVLLLEAGHACDEISHWREPRDPVEDAQQAQSRSRLLLNWQKQFAALLHALKGSAA